MKFFSLITVTLCATVFCACNSSTPQKKIEIMTGEQTAQKVGDAARAAENSENTGILVGTSNDFIEKKAEPKKQALKTGAQIYMNRCSVCHGNGRSGGVAPLTNLGSLEEISAITRDGLPERGMPAWKTYLSEDEIKAVAQFVYDFRDLETP